MSILNNAISSIQIGVEDYVSPDPRRHLSAIRNITAGVLLLYKEALCRKSPGHDTELLIKRDWQVVPGPNGELIFQGKGSKTVDTFQIKERLNDLGVTIDWKRTEEISKLRNDIEHYYTDKSPSAVREVVAKSFIIISGFVANVLKEDPATLLGSACWKTLLETSEVYQAEEAACAETLAAVDWKYHTLEQALDELRCPMCGSALIRAEEEGDVHLELNLRCAECADGFKFGDVAEECVSQSLAGRAYISAIEGDESPYHDCPECGKSTFISEEAACVLCGYEMPETSCERCGSFLSLDEQNLRGLCSYCSHVMEKARNDD